MKRSNVLLKAFSFAFAAIVLFTVSVHETHYLFAEHHAAHEHCENHLHTEDSHSDCSVCKFDVSFFTDHISYPQFNHPHVTRQDIPCIYLSPALSIRNFANSLRGPPSIS
ncbi:MAG: hypothetical protein V4615_17265 [Bacteroidota bacterium]